MEIYLFLFICLLFVVHLSHRHDLPKLHVISFALLLIVSSFRADTVGTDTSTYIEMFRTQVFDVDIEVGFKILVKFINLYTSNYTVFLSTVAIFQFVILYLFIKLTSKDVAFSLFLFMSLGYFFFYLSGMRQSIAISLFLMALHFYNLNHYVKALVLVGIAGLFHTTVLVFIPLVVLINYTKVGKKAVYVAVVLSLIFGRSGLFDFQNLLNVFDIYDKFQGEGVLDRYKGYGDFKEELVLSNLGFIRTAILPSMLFLFTYYHTKAKNNFYIKLYFTGIIFANLMISFPIGFRFAMYLSVLQVIVVPNLFVDNNFSRYKYALLVVYGLAVYLTAINTAYQGVTTYRNDIVPYEVYFEKNINL